MDSIYYPSFSKEYEDSLMPFEKEITTCTSLITYLQRTSSSIDSYPQEANNDIATGKTFLCCADIYKK